ncbi:type IV pilin protein [Halopseudomonas bauzanensis]|uniref:type IV pilin protein n=1 Tax=Halopseudomonas bauzanensis TaxID=653930 RepID=UPI003306454E
MSKQAPYIKKNRRLGFTLIELMIAVAVIGILAAIAYPSYQEYVNKSRRADAQAALLELAQFMERHYTSKGGYLAGGNSGNVPTLPFTKAPKDGSSEFYTLSLHGNTNARSYLLQATPKNSMSGDKCGTLTLSSTGEKGQGAGLTLKDCWGR